MPHALVINQAIRNGRVAREQLAAFHWYRSALRKRLGLTFDFAELPTLTEVERHVAAHPADVLFIQASWHDKAQDIAQTLGSIRAAPRAPKIVFIDFVAGTCTPFFPVLGEVDVYIKRQRFTDLTEYQKDYQGGFIVTDYMAR